jgi:acyl carrier protein phosphodiesterase
MNFLAHLHLADPDPGLLLGGIVADFAKPAELATLPPEVQDGVRLHRLIDGFTDSHPLVRASVARIAPEFHWFSGIIIDIYYDHILAREWGRYSLETLESFASRSYVALETLLPYVRSKAADFIRWMIEDQRLQRYATLEGIEDTLERLSRRIVKRIPKNTVRLEDAMPLLRDQDARLVSDFHAFYPELMAFAARARGEIGRV